MAADCIQEDQQKQDPRCVLLNSTREPGRPNSLLVDPRPGKPQPRGERGPPPSPSPSLKPHHDTHHQRRSPCQVAADGREVEGRDGCHKTLRVGEERDWWKRGASSHRGVTPQLGTKKGELQKQGGTAPALLLTSSPR